MNIDEYNKIQTTDTVNGQTAGVTIFLYCNIVIELKYFDRTNKKLFQNIQKKNDAFKII